MFIVRSLSAVIALSLLFTSCSLDLIKRKPSSAKVHSHSFHDPLGLERIDVRDEKQRVHRYKGLLKPLPLRFLALQVVKLGLKIYIKRLPLAKEVKERVIKNIKDKKFSKHFVPFLLGLKNLYTAGKKYRKKNFKRYVLKNFERTEQAGLEHSLFTFDKKEKKEDEATASEESSNEANQEQEDKSPMANMIASVITIFDAMILSDPNFTLQTPPQRSPDLTGKISPHVKQILDTVLAGMDPHSETYEAVHAIAAEPERVFSASASLIDAIHLYAYKHYQMLAGRYEHKAKMKKWFEQASEEQIVKYLKESQNRKYAFHIMVDGLQGALMQALSLGDTNSPFLQTTYNEYKNPEQFKPKNLDVITLGDNQMDYLDYVIEDNNDALKDKRYLPFFKKLYAEHANTIAMQGVSTTPTISVRNIPIIQTGATVAGANGTGLPNFHFVNREEDRAYYFFGNDAILLEELTQKSGMKTIPQRLPRLNTLNCMATYEAGFDWSFDPLLNLVLGEMSRDYGEVLCLEELSQRIKNEKKVRKLRKRYLKLARKGKKAKVRRRKILKKIAKFENETIPEYVAYYNPWPDHFAHFTGPFADEIISPTGELNRLDYWLGIYSELYKEAGIYDQTLFAMSGDHGLSPVKYSLNPEKAIFDSLRAEGYKIIQNKISSDEGEGPKLSDHVNPPSQRGYDVVVASTAGGNHMMDFFVGQGEEFKRQPVYSELIDYQLLSGQKLNVIDEILNRLDDTLDYLVVREQASSIEKSVTRVIAKREGKKVEALIYRRGNKIFYDSPTDLLEVNKVNPYRAVDYSKSLEKRQYELYKKCLLNASKEDVKSWCDEHEWRKLTAFTPRPDSVAQLSRLYDTPLAGTVNVFPARFVGFNTKVPGKHAGEQFEEKDAFTAVWCANFKTSQKVISEINGSPAATIYEYLSGKRVRAGQDGFGYRSFFENK